jgi:hypothetical protein
VRKSGDDKGDDCCFAFRSRSPDCAMRLKPAPPRLAACGATLGTSAWRRAAAKRKKRSAARSANFTPVPLTGPDMHAACTFLDERKGLRLIRFGSPM